MLALVLSDVHNRIGSLEQIVKLIHNRNVDLVLILGDLTNFGGERETMQVLKEIPKAETFAIPGNLDTKEVLETLEKRGISLHGKKKKFGNFTFAGFGGGLLGNAGSFLSSEEQIERGVGNLLTGENNAILLTHLPPIDTSLDLSSKGTHIGSKSVKKIIEKEQPILHLCGHAHSSFGEEKLGKTISINTGAVKEGRALLLHLEEGIKWERIQI